MTDSLKFGPEWLRNLAGDGCTGGGGGGGNPVTPRYQLAEHRYGREEMLALFDHSYRAPEPLTSYIGLYVPKIQLPLALIQMTEEETRLWNGGVSASVGRGRGGSVDRGGRLRSGRTGSHFRSSFEDDGPRIETQPFMTRSTRSFDRPPLERGWSDRNGGIDSVEWNGSISPRKESSRGLSGSSLMESNWRRHRGGEDEEGWRTNSKGEKWIKGSWREADKDRGEKIDGDEDKRGERWDHKGSNRAFDPHPPLLRRNRLNHHNNHDNLPEWAVENPSESGGSFDSSGAFHGVYSDDDDENADGRLQDHRRGKRGSRVRRVSEGNAPHSKSSSAPKGLSRPLAFKSEHPLNGERPKSLHSESRSDLSEKESRRSLSPIRSPPPTSPISSKASATPSSSSGSADTGGGQVAEAKKTSVTKQQEKPLKNPTASTQAPTSKNKLKTDSAKKSEDAKAEKSKAERSKTASNTGTSVKMETPKEKPPSIAQPKLPSIHQQHIEHNIATSVAASVIESHIDEKQKSVEADNLDRMEKEVAKLIDHQDEKPPSSVLSSSSLMGQPVLENSSTQAGVIQEKWFYRDPQGEVQGPFFASEMAEWHKQGYFAPNLLVRRTCDERYTTLGELMNLCGRVPFKPGTNFPPLKISDSMMSSGVPGPVPAGLSINSGMPKPNLEDPILMYQYQQYRLLQNQQLLLKQLRATAISKLSQTEQWASLSSVEQNQLVVQYMRQLDPDLPIDLPQPPPSMLPNTFMPPMPQTTGQPSNTVLQQLFPQLHQPVAKTQTESTPRVPPSSHPVHSNQQMPGQPIDPIQQLMQQMSGMRNLPPMPPQAAMAPSPPQLQTQTPPQDDNPIKSWLRQLGVNANGPIQQQQPPPQSQPPIDSVWHHQPPPHLTSFNAQTWMSQVGPIQPTIPPGQLSGSLWDVHPKEMKTEQQILEEQNIKMQEEKKKEEQRKKKEMDRHQAEMERLKRQQEEELARLKAAEEAVKRDEAERKKHEEEKRRREEERRQQEEEQRKLEEKRRKEEERRREEKRKHDEEMNRKKQEEEKRRRDELKRQEEKLRKEEEKRKKLEDEQRRQEEERLRKEEEARKKVEAEEQARKAEQRRREAEALRKLQERSKAPWAQAPPAPPPTVQTSLVDIQRLEREKKAEELKLQQILQQQQLAQQKLVEAKEAALTDSAKRLQFKWAEKAAPPSNVNQVKSFSQIQQEEQERIVKVKQQERERQEKEKASQKESAAPVQNVSIWGTASQSLTWSNNASSNIPGFWDEPGPKVNTAAAAAAAAAKATAVAAAKQAQAKQQAAAAAALKAAQQKQQLLQQQQQQQQQHQQQQNSKAGKHKNEKEKEMVKNIFERNTAKTDDFTQWCNKTLSGLQVEVDIPTFITFLRDIEAAYEVKEYVRMYLGDGKQCAEFAKQFLEKRSKWRSAQRPQSHADDLNKPAPAINPNASTEFQEVKSKSKKPKKGKMYKVDSKMLGFNVMSAPDRINVGDRDYAEEV